MAKAALKAESIGGLLIDYSIISQSFLLSIFSVPGTVPGAGLQKPLGSLLSLLSCYWQTASQTERTTECLAGFVEEWKAKLIPKDEVRLARPFAEI